MWKGFREGFNTFRIMSSRAPSPAAEGALETPVPHIRVLNAEHAEIPIELGSPVYWVDSLTGVVHFVCLVPSPGAGHKLLCLVHQGRGDRPWGNDAATGALSARICKCLGGKLTAENWGPFLYALTKGSGQQRDVDAAVKQFRQQVAKRGVVLLRYGAVPPDGVPAASPASVAGPTATVTSADDSPAPAEPAPDATAASSAAARIAAAAFDDTASVVAARVDELHAALRERAREVEQLKAALATQAEMHENALRAAAQREHSLAEQLEERTRLAAVASAAADAAITATRGELKAALRLSTDARLALQDSEMTVHALQDRVSELEAASARAASTGVDALAPPTNFLERLLEKMDAMRDRVEAIEKSPSRATPRDDDDAAVVERELRKAEVATTVRPWLELVQKRALALQSAFPPPRQGTHTETMASLAKSKLSPNDVIEALLGPSNCQKLHQAIVGTCGLPIVATPEAALGAVVCNTFFLRQGGRTGIDDIVSFVHAARGQKTSMEKMKTLLLRVTGADRDEEATNLLFVLSYESFFSEWGFKQRDHALPLRPERDPGVSAVDIGVVVSLLYTLAGVKKEAWSASLWAEKTQAKHPLPCVPPLHLVVPTDNGYRKVALQWNFFASS